MYWYHPAQYSRRHQPRLLCRPLPCQHPHPILAARIILSEDLQNLVNSFQDAMNIANNTDVNLLIHPILRLQEIQKEIRQVKVPACLQSLKDDSVQYTVSVIDYLLIFMNTQNPRSEDLTKAIQDSQLQWQQVLNDFNSVLSTAGISSIEMPSHNQSLRAAKLPVQ